MTMKKNRTSIHWTTGGLCLLACTVLAQQPATPPAGVQGVQGVKQEAIADVKNPQTGNAASSGGVVNPGTKADTQGVNKVNGVETINGVKSDGRDAILPTPPPPPTGNMTPPPPPPPPTGVEPTPPPAVEPPPPPIVSAGGTTVPAGGGSVGSAANIRAVQGVGGINTTKLQNLEAALGLKKDSEVTPNANGAGKGRAAAAGLLTAPLEKQPGPKEDGRAGFQEFEKLQNTGS